MLREKMDTLSWISCFGFGGRNAIWKTSADGLERTRPLLEKIPLNPPSIVFPIVWTILYLLMGISAARVFLKKDTLVETLPCFCGKYN